jgi:hypothetical protein
MIANPNKRKMGWIVVLIERFPKHAKEQNCTKNKGN